jgi:hypothetical protein
MERSSSNEHLCVAQTRAVRCMGSCALDMCSVACGRADVAYEFGFGGPWCARALCTRRACMLQKNCYYAPACECPPCLQGTQTC